MPENYSPLGGDKSNWVTEVGKAAKEKIEAADYMANEDYLQYSITLTPDNIRSIQSYNASTESRGAYINEPTGNCEKTSDGLYLNCTSKFINELRGMNNEGNTSYGTLNKDYQKSK